MTRRKKIINEIKAALEQILISNGYVTDAGLNVFLDKVALEESGDFPAINIDESTDTNTAGSHLNWTKVTLPISIEAFNRCTPATSNDKAHELIGDIKKAVFTHVKDDPANYELITYQSSDIAQRESGSDLIVVNVLIDVTYTEDLADPEG